MGDPTKEYTEDYVSYFVDLADLVKEDLLALIKPTKEVGKKAFVYYNVYETICNIVERHENALFRKDPVGTAFSASRKSGVVKELHDQWMSQRADYINEIVTALANCRGAVVENLLSYASRVILMIMHPKRFYLKSSW